MDFSWGFQVNLSSGRRSRNLRVMGAWISDSASSDFAMDIVILLFDFHFELVKAKADPSLPHPNGPKPGSSGTRFARDDKIAGTRRLSRQRAQAGFISQRTRDGKPSPALLD